MPHEHLSFTQPSASTSAPWPDARTWQSTPPHAKLQYVPLQLAPVAPGGSGHGVHDRPHPSGELSAMHLPEQSCVPAGHAHVPAAVQVRPSPAAPHDAPAARLAPLSMQTGAPVAQLVLPAWHGFAGAHGALLMQDTHTPAEHTWSSPHVVPSVAVAPVSTHASGAPLQLRRAPS
jgi:hypothetical protein